MKTISIVDCFSPSESILDILGSITVPKALISAKGTSEWGKSGSNGGNVTLNAKNQTLTGNIEVDNISTLTMNLSNKTTYEGTINKDNNAKEINIKLDKDSKLILTGNSYIKSLEDEDESYSNIDFNGYTLYVNGTAIK